MTRANGPSTKPATRLRVTSGLLLGCVALVASGCTGLWLLVQDPEGLPCASDGECLDAYVCIDEICRRAAAKVVGDACTIDSECETLICADAYDPAECGDQLSCQKINRTEAEFQCRAPCSGVNNDVRQECSTGEGCHRVAAREVRQLFCQEGVCDVDSDCGVNSAVNPNKQNLCTGAAANDGESGSCARGCDPLQCDVELGCTGCPQTEASCENIDFAAADRFGCLPAGVALPGERCDYIQNFCAPGAFCSSTAADAVCRKYCNFGGGAPQCDDPDEFCNFLSGTDNIGFCQ